MADSRLERLANVLVSYSTGIEPGDIVLLETTPLAAPLLRALYRGVVGAGGHPQVRIGLDGAAEALLSQGSDEQIQWVNPMRSEDFERADVRIAVEASSNTRELTGVDPARQARYSVARESLRERYLERSRGGELRSVVSAYPTTASAQDAEMSLEDYEDFVYRAGFLDRDDPVATWRELGERLGRLSAWLSERRSRSPTPRRSPDESCAESFCASKEARSSRRTPPTGSPSCARCWPWTTVRVARESLPSA